MDGGSCGKQSMQIRSKVADNIIMYHVGKFLCKDNVAYNVWEMEASVDGKSQGEIHVSPPPPTLSYMCILTGRYGYYFPFTRQVL